MPRDWTPFMERAVPGEELTKSPDSSRPWRKPPEFTDQQEAQEAIFADLISEETLPNILEIIRSGMPVTTLSHLYLQKGFGDGRWTPDLLMLLLEPTSIMIIAIAREFGIDPVIKEPKLKKAIKQQQEQIEEYQEQIPEETMEEETAAPEETEMPSLLGGM